MLRSALCAATALALAAGLWGQNPSQPANPSVSSSTSPGNGAATAQLPPMAAPPSGPAPSNPNAATFLGGEAGDGAAPLLPPALRPNPRALRVYVQLPNGPDALQISGLMQQYLFNSHEVVVTENASNASVILKGTIYRQPIPAAAPHASAAARRRARRRAAARRRAEEPAIAAAASATFRPARFPRRAAAPA